MGSFSWCTSDTRKSIPCCIPFGDLPGTVYLLNPFGEPYKESDYEGYGVFGGRDVYELVVEWNREYLTKDNIHKPERSQYRDGPVGDTGFSKALENYEKTCEAIADYAAGASDDFMKETYGKFLANGFPSNWKRSLGITLACYERDLVKLKYPIKIVEHPVPYERAGISPNCPFQGCIYPETMKEIRTGVNKAFDRLAKEEENCRSRPSLDNMIQAASASISSPHNKEKAPEMDR